MLSTFSLQGNRLTQIENLDTLTQLQELHISDNGITVLQNLEKLVSKSLEDVGEQRLCIGQSGDVGCGE